MDGCTVSHNRYSEIKMSHICNSLNKEADGKTHFEERHDFRPGLLRASSHLQFFLQLLVLLSLGESLLLLQMVVEALRL